jgi:predicted component of type VI protein secretion system
MEAWKREFLYQLKIGVRPDIAAKQAACRNISEVMLDKESDPLFSRLWDEIRPLDDADRVAAGRALNRSNLEMILRAQATDMQASAYFGMRKDDFLKRVKDNVELSIIYDTARYAGQADMLLAQRRQAIDGDSTMLKVLGTNYLGQSNEPQVNINLTENKPIDVDEAARRIAAAMDYHARYGHGRVPSQPVPAVIDAEPVEPMTSTLSAATTSSTTSAPSASPTSSSRRVNGKIIDHEK